MWARSTPPDTAEMHDCNLGSMPADTDPAFIEATEGYGARVHRIDGLITALAEKNRGPRP